MLLDFLVLMETNRARHQRVTVTVAADPKTTTAAVACAASIDTRSSWENGPKAWRERHDGRGLECLFLFVWRLVCGLDWFVDRFPGARVRVLAVICIFLFYLQSNARIE